MDKHKGLREEATSEVSLASSVNRKRTNLLLWMAQGVLAALFIFAGAMKLVMPVEELKKQSSLSGPFLRFIGVAEVLGAIGLIVPALLSILPILTPTAAMGLFVIMIGAILQSVPMGPVVFIPTLTAVLTAFVAYGRTRLVPIFPKEQIYG